MSLDLSISDLSVKSPIRAGDFFQAVKLSRESTDQGLGWPEAQRTVTKRYSDLNIMYITVLDSLRRDALLTP